MGEIIYNKLVRDGIPEIIRADNAEPVVRILTDDQEYIRALLEKLVEEAKELLESGGSLDERVDVAQVTKAIDEFYGYTPEIVQQSRIDKEKKRGGFASRIFLEKVVNND